MHIDIYDIIDILHIFDRSLSKYIFNQPQETVPGHIIQNITIQ